MVPTNLWKSREVLEFEKSPVKSGKDLEFRWNFVKVLEFFCDQTVQKKNF